ASAASCSVSQRGILTAAGLRLSPPVEQSCFVNSFELRSSVPLPRQRRPRVGDDDLHRVLIVITVFVHDSKRCRRQFVPACLLPIKNHDVSAERPELPLLRGEQELQRLAVFVPEPSCERPEKRQPIRSGASIII